METKKIDMFMMQHRDKFAAVDHLRIRTELEKVPDECLTRIATASFKSPTTSLVLAWLLGLLGVGAFYVKKIVFGVTQILLYVLIWIFAILSMLVVALAIGESEGAYLIISVMFYVFYVGLALYALVMYVIGIIKARKWVYEYNLCQLNKAISMP